MNICRYTSAPLSRVEKVFLLLVVASVFIAGCSSNLVKAGATQEGLASFYAKEFHGRKTSSGEQFDMNALTAAHRTYPFGTIVKITNLKNGQEVEVKINDRGPVKPERIIDLSFAAAKVIGLDRMGLARVRLEVLEWGP